MTKDFLSTNCKNDTHTDNIYYVNFLSQNFEYIFNTYK